MADKTRPERRVTWQTSVQPVHTLKCLWNHRINGTAEHCCICIPGRACVERFVDLLAANDPSHCPRWSLTRCLCSKHELNAAGATPVLAGPWPTPECHFVLSAVALPVARLKGTAIVNPADRPQSPIRSSAPRLKTAGARTPPRAPPEQLPGGRRVGGGPLGTRCFVFLCALPP